MRCNEQCVHCYRVIEGRRELTTAEVKVLLADLTRAGTLYLTFSAVRARPWSRTATSTGRPGRPASTRWPGPSWPASAWRRVRHALFFVLRGARALFHAPVPADVLAALLRRGAHRHG